MTIEKPPAPRHPNWECRVCTACPVCFMAFVDAGYGPPDSPKGWDANDGMRHLSLLMHGDPEVHWTTEQVYRAMCYHTELSRDEDGIHCIDPRCQTFWPWGEVYAELRTKVR